MPDIAGSSPGVDDPSVRSRYALLASCTRDLILFVRASDGRILEANDAARAAYGLRNPIGEVTIGDLRAPGTSADLSGQMAEAIDRGVVFETFHRRADGTVFPVEVSSKGASLDGTQVLVSVVRDISDRRRAETAQRDAYAAADQLAKVAASVPGVVCSFLQRPDGSACMPFSSPAIEDLYGIPRETLARDMGPCFTRFHPDDLGRVWKSIQEAGATMSPWHCEYRYLHPTKGLRWIEGKSVPRAEPDGSLLWHGYVADVTDRKLAETALAESEKRLHDIVDAFPGVLGLYDDRGRLLFMNRFGLDRLGRTLAEVSGMRHDEFVPPGMVPATSRALERAFETGEPQFVELDTATEWGREESTLVTYVPVARSDGGRQVMGFAMDVTAQHRALELGALQSAVDRLPIGVIVMQGFPGRIPAVVATNGAFERFVKCRVPAGTSADHVPYQLFHPDRATPFQLGQMPGARAIEGRESAGAAEVHVRLPDGTWRIAAVSGAPLGREAPDGIRRAVAVILDVTEAREAEHRSQQSQRRLEMVLDGSSDGFWDMDLRARRVTRSGRFAEIRGNPAEPQEVSLDDGMGPVHPEDQPRMMQVLGELANGRAERAGLEYRTRHADGSWRWVRARGKVVERDGSGRPVRIAGSMTDIQAEKEALDKAIASEARFRDVVASADEYVFEMDGQGNVTYISEAVEAVLGWRPDEIVGRSSLEFMDAEEQARSLAFLSERAARRERFSHYEQTAVHRSGRKVWLDVSAVPVIGPDGAFLGYRGTAMDVTHRHEADVERERLQAQLAQAQKMEVVGRLAGGVAHDFNNLLTVILASGGSLREEMAGAPAEQLEDLDAIVAAGERARDLTRQLLMFARKHAVAPVQLDLNEIVDRSRVILQRLLREDIELRVSVHRAPCPVRADPNQIEQVLLNLVVNAIDAMPGGGVLTIQTEDAVVDSDVAALRPDRAPGHWCRLVVRDTGVGMSPEVQAHVFEPFFTTKGPGKGSGLGLATVYGIVQQADGHVHLQSAPGRGTVIEICLPRTDGVASVSRSTPAPTPRGGRETILVVEDDPQVRAVTVRTLRRAGYEVLAASRPSQAIELFGERARGIEMLLTDVIMPGMSGAALAAELRRRQPALPVLFVSGYTQDASVEPDLLRPGVDLLEKPFTGEALLRSVREVLDRGGAPPDP